MPFRMRLRTSALLACLAAASSVSPGRAWAQDANGATSSANVAAARRHFERARDDYGQGAYREAIAELEAAHSLDPTAKDLVFNLGVVHEKLSDIDDALEWFQLYTTMSLTPTEHDRADSYIRRLEGAKKELTQKPPAAPGTAPPPPPVPRPLRSAPPDSPGHGRVDAATIVAASVAGAALAFGTVLAVKADEDRPVSGFVTGQDGTYANLTDRVNTAHREAVIADVGFGVSLAAGVTAAVLYFARTRDPSSAAPPSPRISSVSATPLTGGGALVVQGSL